MTTPSYDVPAVRKAIRLLELLSCSPRPLGIAEISRALGLNTNMVFRLVTVLRDEQWLVQEPTEPKYRISAHPFRLLNRSLSQVTLHEAAANPMRELWRQTGETVYLAILHGDCALFLENIDGTNAIRIAGMVGGCYPLHCTAAGKVLLAHADEEVLARVLANGLHRFTDRTIVEEEALRAHLRMVAAQGWAMDTEEHGRGILCFATPVHDAAHAVVGAIGISVTTITHTPDDLLTRIAPLVLEAGRAASAQLGASSTTDAFSQASLPSDQC
jgi:DNA-binding IclR family transcriptional regulator